MHFIVVYSEKCGSASMATTARSLTLYLKGQLEMGGLQVA